MSHVNRRDKILDLLTHHIDIHESDLMASIGCTIPTIKEDIKKLNDELKGTAVIYLSDNCYFIEIKEIKAFQRAKSDIKRNLDFNSPQKEFHLFLNIYSRKMITSRLMTCVTKWLLAVVLLITI